MGLRGRAVRDEDIPIPVTAEEWRDAWYRHVPMYRAENAALREELAKLYAQYGQDDVLAAWEVVKDNVHGAWKRASKAGEE